jgi:hypothetical protein
MDLNQWGVSTDVLNVIYNIALLAIPTLLAIAGIVFSGASAAKAWQVLRLVVHDLRTAIDEPGEQQEVSDVTGLPVDLIAKIEALLQLAENALPKPELATKEQLVSWGQMGTSQEAVPPVEAARP